MPFQSLQELLLFRPPPIPEVISQGILYEGTKLVIFGEPKTYKSLIAEQLAFCIAVGTPWLGFHTLQQRVAFTQAEVPRWLFRKRTVAMASNITIPPNMLFFDTRRDLKLDRTTDLKEFEKDIARIAPKVLFLDPMYKYISGPEEPVVLRFADNLDYLIDKYHLTVVLVHHSRKPRATMSGSVIDQGGSELRGPIIEMWADSIIRVKGDLMVDERTLDFELRHADTLIYPVDVRLNRRRLWLERI